MTERRHHQLAPELALTSDGRGEVSRSRLFQPATQIVSTCSGWLILRNHDSAWGLEGRVYPEVLLNCTHVLGDKLLGIGVGRFYPVLNVETLACGWLVIPRGKYLNRC